MINNLFMQNAAVREIVHKEGELYKTVELHGHTFSLYYGYYEECDRKNPEVDPMPIYPDFEKNPQYTDDGFPFVTKMQDACKHFKGAEGIFSECAECEFYLHGDELLGMCSCVKNKTNSDKEAKV